MKETVVTQQWRFRGKSSAATKSLCKPAHRTHRSASLLSVTRHVEGRPSERFGMSHCVPPEHAHAGRDLSNRDERSGSRRATRNDSGARRPRCRDRPTPKSQLATVWNNGAGSKTKSQTAEIRVSRGQNQDRASTRDHLAGLLF